MKASSSRLLARFFCLPAFFTLVLEFAAPNARAQQELFTPEHVAKLRSVSSIAISPDGKRVAYGLSVPRKPFTDEDGAPWLELHVVDSSGVSRPFITGEVNVDAIEWKPDGSAISFLAKRGKDKTKSVYVIPVDGGEAKNVLVHETDISGYTWSPAGDRLAFTATEKKQAAKEKNQEKGFKQEIYEEDFSPARVWVADLAPGAEKPRKLDLPGSVSSVRWSPVGTHLAMGLSPTPLVDDEYMRRKVHIFDADSGAIVSSFQNPGKLGSFAWSPDGKRLAVISAEDIHDPDASRLLLANPADGSLRDILPNYAGQVQAIRWQDNDTIMFLGDEGVWSTFGEVRADGSGLKTHIGKEKLSASTFSLSKEGQCAAMIIDSPRHPGEVFRICHGDAAPQRLTDSNPWLSELRFAPQDVVEYTARDGLLLQGLLIRPLDEERGKRYPLIMRVHGGPEAHDRQGWLTNYNTPGQVGAAQGFAVFCPNYRGSTGRGVAFSKLGQGDPAGREFDDLVDAADALIATGLVDKDKVGITGGSYGGYATAWCSTYFSERFAAGVMFVGISDITAKAGTTDIPDEEMLVHALNRPWDNWQMYAERSPIHHVQKSRTPLLIMHGKDDPRVHVSQSLALYRHLKTLDQAPVRLVLYPGEGHGNRKAAARYDYSLRMMQWFNHYLKGPGGMPPPYELDYASMSGDEKDATKN